MPAAPAGRHRGPALLLAALCLPWAPGVLAQPAPPATQAPRDAFELGAVVDVRRPQAEGLRVMAVTPGGAADRLGLRAGDRLLSLNGQALAGVDAPREALARALQAGDGRLQVRVRRDGEELDLAGTADLQRATGSAQCGLVATYRPGGTLPAGLLAVDIVQVEGRGVPADGSEPYRLPPGPRVVIVREHVPPAAQRSRALNSYASRAVVIDVAADTRYLLAGRTHGPTASGDAPVWQPVVVQARSEPCR